MAIERIDGGNRLVETGFTHQTVLLHETIDLLQVRNEGVYVDGTLGGGGHTRALLEACAPSGQVVAIDQDQTALDHAQIWGQSYGDRLRIVKGNFRELPRILDQLGIQRVDGVICDLGVSSPQFDEGERGFSYHQEAQLDMRMDDQATKTAKDLLNQWDASELAKIFRDYGEEKWAARVAERIVFARKQKMIETTTELVDLIKAAIPVAARRTGPHPARRIFQALRIAVNDELGALEQLLADVPDCLNTNGRVAVISFHSLEDRIVKKAFQWEATGCICPPRLPQCVCQHVARFKVITRRPVLPSEEEVAENPRARSAKLRVAEKL